MNKVLHWLSHLFSMNYGNVDTYWDADGKLMVRFICRTCGKGSMAFDSGVREDRKKLLEKTHK